MHDIELFTVALAFVLCQKGSTNDAGIVMLLLFVVVNQS